MIEPDERGPSQEKRAVSSTQEGILGADPLGFSQPLRDRLTEVEWQALLQKGRQVQFLEGMVIFQEGDQSDGLYVVLSGRVAVLKQKEDGQSTLLAYRGAGDVLGEMGIMRGKPCSATVIAVEDSELLYIEGQDFSALTLEVPRICQTILCVLAERLHAADVARTTVIQEEQNLAHQLQRWTTEAERLAELARLRQQTVDLIVHDLRSPLAVVKGCLEMLQESMDGTSSMPTQDVLGIARRSTDRLLSMVETLLSAARQEGLGMPSVQEVDLACLLRRTAEEVSTFAAQAGVRLVVSLGDLPYVSGDWAQLERVVWNLLDNAVSYSQTGGQIILTAEVSAQEVLIAVTDTGPGVPPEYREHIFERFGRVPGSRGRHHGFGLGLYSCRQAVQAHGGRIWVEPGPNNVGSRFAFTLPVDPSC